MKAIALSFSVALMTFSSIGCQHMHGHSAVHKMLSGRDCDTCGRNGCGHSGPCDCVQGCQGSAGVCQKLGDKWAAIRAHHAPRTAGYAEMGAASGPAAAQVSYPYYTTRGPRDFLLAHPPSIGR